MSKLFRLLFIVAALVVAFAAGRSSGIAHALNDAEYWITDADYIAPGSYAIGDGFEIGIHLDGDMYINSGFIG